MDDNVPAPPPNLSGIGDETDPTADMTAGPKTRRSTGQLLMLIGVGLVVAIVVLVIGTRQLHNWQDSRWVTSGLDRYTTRDVAAYKDFVGVTVDQNQVDIVELGDLVCKALREQPTRVFFIASGISDVTGVESSIFVLAGSAKYLCPDQLRTVREAAVKDGWPDRSKSMLE